MNRVGIEGLIIAFVNLQIKHFAKLVLRGINWKTSQGTKVHTQLKHMMTDFPMMNNGIFCCASRQIICNNKLYKMY